MKQFSFGKTVIGNIFWSICLSLPVLISFLIANKTGPLPANDNSIEWLALPGGPQLKVNPLAGWEALAVIPRINRSEVDESNSKGLPDHELEQSLPESPLSRRIELFGYIEEGGEPLFCFFDTLGNRWFRLGIDQSDPDSGIMLAQLKENGVLRLIDSRAGEEYLLGSEELSIEQLRDHE